MHRRLFAFALALAAPSLLSAQGVAEALRSSAMEAARGCDYAKYVKLADNLSNVSPTFSSLTKLSNGHNNGWGVPVTDYISLLFSTGSAHAEKQTAAATQQGLVAEFEQVCNTVVQADQMNRQYNLMSAGNLNIGNALKFLGNQLNIKTTRLPNRNLAVTANWAKLYHSFVPSTHTVTDSAYQVLSSSAEQALALADDYGPALDSLNAALTVIERRQVMLADIDTSSASRGWTCPAGYPDPNATGTQTMADDQGVIKPICGRASPGVSVQNGTAARIIDAKAQLLTASLIHAILSVDAGRASVEFSHQQIADYVKTTQSFHY